MITRAPRPTSNFYLLDKAISEDRRLSWSARGILIFLLGKPDHWTVSPAALVNETAKSTRRMGRDGVYAILKELKEVGYLHTIGNRNDGGTFAGADYLVSESPYTAFPDTVDSPYPDLPDTAEPDTANPTQVSIDSKQGLNGKQGLTFSAAPTALPAAIEIQAVPVKQKKASKAKPDDTQDTELQAACRHAWAAYANAYAARYGAAPVRNAKVNANVKQFVQRLGYIEAPPVATFFVERVGDALVVRRMHEFGLLLNGAESYRTQWATGQAMTNTRAQQADKTQSNFDSAQQAKAMLRARREQKNAE